LDPEDGLDPEDDVDPEDGLDPDAGRESEDCCGERLGRCCCRGCC
jgi:hypothetical protein